MTPHPVVSREAWLEARKGLLEEEKTLTRARDALARRRRNLPWVRIDKSYVFEAPTGKVTLADLFDGRSQLAIYHFMLAPGSDHICNGCAFLADHIDAARQHFEQADLSFAAVARARISQIEQVKRRMGWHFRWVSSFETDFNYDFGVSFAPQNVAEARAGYNYGTTPYTAEDLHGTSIFAKDGSGAVYHTYSCYARGNELLAGAFNWLDLTPKGRNEHGVMSWVRLHDEYEVRTPPLGHCCNAK